MDLLTKALSFYDSFETKKIMRESLLAWSLRIQWCVLYFFSSVVSKYPLVGETDYRKTIVTFTGIGNIPFIANTHSGNLRFWWVTGDTILPLPTPSPIQSLLLFPLTRQEKWKWKFWLRNREGNAEETGIPETQTRPQSSQALLSMQRSDISLSLEGRGCPFPLTICFPFASVV